MTRIDAFRFSSSNFTCPPKWQLLLCGWHLVLSLTPEGVRNMNSLLLCLPSLPHWLPWLDLRFKWPCKLIHFSECKCAGLQITPLTRCNKWWTPRMNSPAAHCRQFKKSIFWNCPKRSHILEAFPLFSCCSMFNFNYETAVAFWKHHILEGKPATYLQLLLAIVVFFHNSLARSLNCFTVLLVVNLLLIN